MLPYHRRAPLRRPRTQCVSCTLAPQIIVSRSAPVSGAPALRLRCRPALVEVRHLIVVMKDACRFVLDAGGRVRMRAPSTARSDVEVSESAVAFVRRHSALDHLTLSRRKLTCQVQVSVASAPTAHSYCRRPCHMHTAQPRCLYHRLSTRHKKVRLLHCTSGCSITVMRTSIVPLLLFAVRTGKKIFVLAPVYGKSQRWRSVFRKNKVRVSTEVHGYENNGAITAQSQGELIRAQVAQYHQLTSTRKYHHWLRRLHLCWQYTGIA